MYGYSGYATNTYASSRIAGVIAPLVELAMRTLSLGFNIVQPYVVTQDDFGYGLPFTLQDGSGNPVDISTASLSINVQDAQDATGTVLFSGVMAVDDGTDGTCHYRIAAGNFPNTGTFLAQIVATWSPNEVLTWNGTRVIVAPRLPE
jgi:hypothetical protein